MDEGTQGRVARRAGRPCGAREAPHALFKTQQTRVVVAAAWGEGSHAGRREGTLMEEQGHDRGGGRLGTGKVAPEKEVTAWAWYTNW